MSYFWLFLLYFYGGYFGRFYEESHICNKLITFILCIAIIILAAYIRNLVIINQKKYVPDIKKELTIIPEDDISREDSIIDNSTLLLSNKKQKNSDENDNDFILGNKTNNNSNPFSLKLRKTKQVSSEKKNKYWKK